MTIARFIRPAWPEWTGLRSRFNARGWLQDNFLTAPRAPLQQPPYKSVWPHNVWQGLVM